ncbi:glycosyltransferase family 2 protein [Amycolatopsis sp. CA-128772]|uniref:glycosyltransferase family 2 protein n=1 Tax=Amycolatopsis sp. CA-128772 TaxID=2073159 RepID=UPI000CD0B446|nr:glycosyltransferase family 2 protein [Amycolatopsis sp. CA-128772]
MEAELDVILPCLNEAVTLPGVLAALPPGCHPLVVDNGSTDATATVARTHGARVVVEPRRGYGAAVHAGLDHAEHEYVAVLDADGSLDPAVLPVLLRCVAAGTADLAVGRRRPVGRGVQPWHARAANAMVAALLRRRDTPVHDIAAIRVARRDALLALGVRDRGFGYPLELLLRATRAGWRISELDVAYRARAGGRSKVSGSVRGTVRAALDMAAVAVRG